MEYQAEKESLLNAAVQGGWVTASEFLAQSHKANPGLPPELVKKWAKRWFAKANPKLQPTPRLINHFKVGADPEFAFLAADNSYLHASSIRLGIDTAFGSDMSGRQVELRVWPDRSTLRVTASILDTLRWLAHTTPAAQYKWWGGAVMANDGIGGHIHYGLKKKIDLKCLDHAGKRLLEQRHLDWEGHNQRLAITKYGRPGDIRRTSYGFEYRTLPTWLYSPWATYLTLTIMKLAIYAKVDLKTANSLSLLRRFRALDDDADLCLAAWERLGTPTYFQSADFKGA